MTIKKKLVFNLLLLSLLFNIGYSQELTKGYILNNEVNIVSSWTRLPDFAGSPRFKTGAFTLEGKVYIGAGASMTGVQSDFWCYDPNIVTWTSKADNPGSDRVLPKGFSNSNYGYFGCGRTVDPIRQYSDIWRFDPAVNSWIRIDNFPGGERSHLISCSTEQSGYADTGFLNSSSIFYNDFWRFDP